jgi:transcriptional repressor NrdR
MTTQHKIGDSRVIESREGSDGVSIRRRREGSDGRRFTTYERIEKPNLAIVKKDNSRELYDRDKLTGAIRRSVGKFFESEIEIDEIVTRVEDALYALGENEIPSRKVGQLVLDELLERNEIAYVRFASVYYEFKTLDQFVEAITAARGRKS